MKKRILSILLAVVLVASMVAVSAISASAILEPTGEYTPGEGIETDRFYLYMPKQWENEYTTSAGMYWWNGTDACGSVDGASGGTLAWPGYKARESEEFDNLFYVDVPEDVPTVVWNNYLDGGTDTTLPIYTLACQAIDAAVEFYSDGDSDMYPTEFFEYVEESFYGDKAALGEYADNFFMDTEYDAGMSFDMDNMIFIVDLTKTDVTFDGKMTYGGEWFFYYGNGEYGSYPVKEDAIAMGVYGDLKEAPATPGEAPTAPSKPTVPAPDQDATSAVGGTSTDDTAKGDNTAIQTGAVSLAVVLLVVLAAVSGVVVFTRKRYE